MDQHRSIPHYHRYSPVCEAIRSIGIFLFVVFLWAPVQRWFLYKTRSDPSYFNPHYNEQLEHSEHGIAFMILVLAGVVLSYFAAETPFPILFWGGVVWSLLFAGCYASVTWRFINHQD